MWRKGTPYTASRSISWYNCFGKQYGSSSKNLNRTNIWSSSYRSCSRLLPKEDTNSKRYMLPSVHCSTIYNNQDTEAIQAPINRWINIRDVAYISIVKYYSAIKNWNLAICDNMDGSRVYYKKWSTDRERQRPYDLTYMWYIDK